MKITKKIQGILEKLEDNGLILSKSQIAELISLSELDKQMCFWVSADGNVVAERVWKAKSKVHVS